MKINYQETTSDLLKRIDIHNKYGGKDIDKWMLELIKIKKEMKILDVGCGSGKQCFSYYRYLEGNCDITGGDVSPSLLEQAIKEKRKIEADIKFLELDFNKKFNFNDNTFDFVSCCFAIYYAEDIPFTISEIYRILKPGGRLFTSGPMPQNKQLFYEIIKEATNKQIPPMPGSSRYGSEILDTLKDSFSTVDINIFENPLSFDQVEPFIDYTRASLSEDRKLWSSFFKDSDELEKIIEKIKLIASQRLSSDGKLVMTKVVGGFIASK